MTDVQRAGLSRRELMHRAGVVGGALAGAGLIQTVSAPGVSASVVGQKLSPVLSLEGPLTHRSGNAYNLTVTAAASQPQGPVPSGVVRLMNGVPGGTNVSQAAEATLNAQGTHMFSVIAGDAGEKRWHVTYDGDGFYATGTSNPWTVTIFELPPVPPAPSVP